MGLNLFQQLSLYQAALPIIVVLLLWYTISAILSWYRLRHIPGPFLASFSYLYLAYIQQSGRQYYMYRDEITKYGPLVRVGPNELTTDDPEVLRRMSSARSTYTRDPWYLGGRWNPYKHNLFTTLDTRAHDKMKAQMAAAYGGKDIPALEPGVDAQVRRLVGLIRDKYIAGAKTADLGTLTSYFTMDVITKAGFGEEFGFLKKDEDLFGFHGGVRSHWRFQGMTLDVPWVRNVVYSPWLLKLFGPKMTDVSGLGRLMKVGHDAVARRFSKTESGEKDMLASFISHGLTPEDCEIEGLFMIVAGSETTASVIRVTMLHIISTPRVYNSLKQEITEAIGDGRVTASPIRFEEAKRLPYLQAVIYEGMRMRSAAPGLYPKVVPPKGDFICGKFVPGGTAVGMNTSALLASRHLFGEDAGLFRPERFLEVSEDRRAEMQRDVELMFGYGRWMCAGKPVAFMELNKVFFELFRNFHFQLASPMKPAWDSTSWSVWVDENMWMKITEAPVWTA